MYALPEQAEPLQAIEERGRRRIGGGDRDQLRVGGLDVARVVPGAVLDRRRRGDGEGSAVGGARERGIASRRACSGSRRRPIRLSRPSPTASRSPASVYALPEQAEPLQAIEEVGGVVSGAVIVISCELVGSTLPALSQARYLTVVVAETVKGAL